MAKATTTDPAVIAYAQAILDLAVEQNLAEPIADELASLKGIVQQDRLFAAFLADPAIRVEERRDILIDKVFRGRVSPLMLSFLGVLNEKGRLGILQQISDSYRHLLDVKLGRVKVQVTVAMELSAEMLEDIRQKLCVTLKKDAIIQQKVDASIIGGLVVKVEDKILDASVKAQLNSMRAQLLASKA